MRIILSLACCLCLALGSAVRAKDFVHPGGLHNLEDLERMKHRVAEKAQPWLAGYEKLCEDPLAQHTFKPRPFANLGQSRQIASRDAHAAYLNAIRWYISGDDRHADCAIRILNAWADATKEVPSGRDVPGLSGIPIAEFALAAEVLRVCPRWKADDFDRFKSVMRTYWYPAVRDFLARENGPGNTRFWANWNISNIGACIAIGVLLDDREIFDEGLRYFRSDLGTGALKNAVYFVHPDGLGQWQESGRDQTHAQLGVGMMAQLCEVAWKQGIDLYGEQDNRLLKGAEYVAQYDLWRDVPFKPYNNSSNANQRWASINSRGRLDRPVWELIYNHYFVRKGLAAPNTAAFAKLTRIEGGSGDHFGYGTLTFTLDAAKSPFPPSPVPASPTELKVESGVGRVFIRWAGSGDTTQGYEVRRRTLPGGAFAPIASWTTNTRCEHTDDDVEPGKSYAYVVASRNQAGTSDACGEVAVTTGVLAGLPPDWKLTSLDRPNDATFETKGGFADVSGGTFVITGGGAGVGGKRDSTTLAHRAASGDFTFTARISRIDWARGGRGQRVGIMVRESGAPDARAVLMKLGDVGARQAGAASRSTPGANMTWRGGNDYTWLPAWFRIHRSGDTFTAFESSDGSNWFEVMKADIRMPADAIVGLFVTSGGPGATTAHFDHVTLEK